MLVREDRDDVAVLRMAHGKVSALDEAFCQAMSAEIARIEAQPLRALVVTGTGSAFSAGVDLYRILDGGAEYVRRFLPLMEQLFRTLLVFPKPLVAAINGHAIAGGCIIAAAADHRVMAKGGARIGVPEVVVGVPFPSLPLEMIAARLSPAVVRSVVYDGRTVHADEAVSIGFVDEAVDPSQLLDRSLAVARQLASIPARTFALTKRAFSEAVLQRVQASGDSNADVVEAWLSADVHDAIRRYLDKTIKRAQA
jgi:enoyl-CoA hydratase/carnithine racemase